MLNAKETWADEKRKELLAKGKGNWDEDDWEAWNYIEECRAEDEADAEYFGETEPDYPDWYEADAEREAYGISGWSADPWDDLDRDLNDRYYLTFE